jgi:hypothetical protein
LSKRSGRGRQEDEFLVSWGGVWREGPKKGQKYDESDNTWLPRSQLKGASHIVGMFEEPEKFLTLPRGKVIHGMGKGKGKNTSKKVKKFYFNKFYFLKIFLIFF